MLYREMLPDKLKPKLYNNARPHTASHNTDIYIVNLNLSVYLFSPFKETLRG